MKRDCVACGGDGYVDAGPCALCKGTGVDPDYTPQPPPTRRPSSPHRAVVIACTAAKLSRPAVAGRIYTGVTWSAWRKHGPPDLSMPIGWSLWALSAKHGLVRSWEPLEPYERKLTPKRSAVLMHDVRAKWERFTRRVDESWSGHTPTHVEAVVVGGDLYQNLATAAGLPIVGRIHGRPKGIGILRRRLVAWAAEVRRHSNVSPHAEGAWPPSIEGCEP